MKTPGNTLLVGNPHQTKQGRHTPPKSTLYLLSHVIDQSIKTDPVGIIFKLTVFELKNENKRTSKITIVTFT